MDDRSRAEQHQRAHSTVVARRRWILTLVSRFVNILRLRGRPAHRANVRRSRKVLRTLRSFLDRDGAARSLAYLRKIEPLIFEEVIMSALEDAGVLVLRSCRYSGDGGVDGAFWCPEAGWMAVQAKRYSAHIDRQHVDEFINVIRRTRYAGGVFAHTGRSGAGVYEILPRSGIILYSGDRLIELIKERKLVHWRLS